MEYPVVCVLSGPEKTRAKAELALEKARLTIIPSGEWPIQRQSNQAEHWPHLTPIRLAWDDDEQAYLPPEGTDPNEEHGFVAVLAETEKAFHRAYECVEPHGWVLRTHYELPEKPKPDPMSELIDTLLHRLDSQEQRIADLTRRVGGHPSIGGAGFETGAGEFMQLGSYSAAQMRRSVFSWAARNTSTVGSATANTPGAISGGLFGSTDMQLSANVSGLVVNISTGECLIPGQEAANQGGYHGFYSTSGSVTLATANATNPRIDLVCATSGDASYTLPSGGTSGAVTIQAVTGTPTSGATLSNLSGAPTLPLSSLLLGYVLVLANATNLTGANIANKATQVQLQSIMAGDIVGELSFTTTSNFNIAANGWTYPAGVSVAITVPSSGKVRVTALGGGIQANATGNYAVGANTSNSGTPPLIKNLPNPIGTGTYVPVVLDGFLAGLTPGAAATVYLAAYNPTGSAGSLWVNQSSPLVQGDLSVIVAAA